MRKALQGGGLALSQSIRSRRFREPGLFSVPTLIICTASPERQIEKILTVNPSEAELAHPPGGARTRTPSMEKSASGGRRRMSRV